MNNLPLVLFFLPLISLPTSSLAQATKFEGPGDGFSLLIPPSYDKVLAYGPEGRERIGWILSVEEQEGGHNFRHCDMSLTTVALDDLRITTEVCPNGAPPPGSWATLGLNAGDKVNFMLTGSGSEIVATVSVPSGTLGTDGIIVRFDDTSAQEIDAFFKSYSSSYFSESTTAAPDGTSLYVPTTDAAGGFVPIAPVDGGEVGLFWISPSQTMAHGSENPDDRG